MAHDVFVSYPSADKSTADAIVHALESQDVRCWYAPRDIAPGTEWAAAIVRAIRASQAMVLVLSDAANNSDHILREVRQAADAGLPIIPVRTTPKEPNESLQYYLGGTHWLDALTPPLEEHLGELVDTVRRALGDDAPPAIDGQLPAPQISPPDRPPFRRPRVWAAVVGIATAVAAIAITLSMILSDSSEDLAATETADPATTTPVTTSAAPSTVPPTEPILVCQVNTTAGSFDSPFFTDAWKGVQDAVRSGFASTDSRFLEGPSTSDGTRHVETFLADECDLIITVGALLSVLTGEYAASHPDALFVAVDTSYSAPTTNLRAVDFQTDEAAFLAGYLAAGMTNTGTVGAFGGYDIAPVNTLLNGFMWGVEHFNSANRASVRIIGWGPGPADRWYLGNFEVIADGQLFAEALIAEGADIIFPVAGTAGLGAATAARDAGDVAVIGVDGDGFYTDIGHGDLYLTSVLKNVDVGVFDAIGDASAGTFDNEPFLGTLDNGGVSLSPFHAFAGLIPPDLVTEIENLHAAIRSGAITPGTQDDP